MQDQVMAWPKQSETRQWEKPEGDDPRTLYQMMKTSVERFGSTDAFGYIPAPGMSRVNVTYNQLGDLTDAAAKALMDRGVVAGDRIAIIVDNSVEWAVLSYAANAFGAAYTAMYTHQHGSEWSYIINDSTPSLVAIANTGCLDKLVDSHGDDASKWPQNGVLLLGDEPANKLPPEGIEVVMWTDFVAAGRASETELVVADDPFALNTLIYTSGTTGNPKGVMLTNWNTLSNILCVQAVFPIYIGDRTAAFLPWAHSFGATFDLNWMIRSGVHINLVSDITKLADEMMEIKPAVLVAVPRVWNKFYDRVNAQLASSGVKRFMASRARKHARKRLDKSGVHCDAVTPSGALDKLFDKLVWSKVRARFGGNLRFAISGSAALSPDVADFIQMVGISCFEGYGLTETSPLVSANGWMGYGKSRLNTVGMPANGVTVTIDHSAWDDPDRPDEGEIVVSGPNIMQGYWNLPDKTAEVIMEDGSFRTGDLGKMVDGYLSITGRVKSQFKLENGKYVAPAPLEENLKLSPLVEQAVLDGGNRKKTFLIVHPNIAGVRELMAAKGISAPGDNEELCNNKEVAAALLAHLKETAISAPTWKGYEIPDALILDHVEWTTDNELLTPSMKVKLRNILSRHADAISEL